MLMYFNGLLLLSAQFVRIATNDMLVNTNGTVFVSVHRVRIATETQSATWRGVTLCLSALRADHNDPGHAAAGDGGLCLNALRADHNGKCAQSTACGFVECAVSR